MDRVRRAGMVAQIAGDAERMFGADGDAATLDAYAREAVLELWMTRGNLTVVAARRLLREVRQELARRHAPPPRALDRRIRAPLAA